MIRSHLTYINILEKIYLLLSNSNVNSKDNLLNNVTTVSKILIQLQKLFSNNQNFIKLFGFYYGFLSYLPIKWKYTKGGYYL